MPTAASFVQIGKGNSPPEKKLKTQGAAGCPPVNWSLHLLEAVAETRSTLTDISKVCIVLLLWHLERLISLTLCIISKVINH